MTQEFRKMRKLGIYLSEAVATRLRIEAEARRMSGSSIIECALSDFLDKSLGDRQSILGDGGGALRRQLKPR